LLEAEAAADLALLRGAAEEAGRIALRYYGRNPEVWMKGGTSPVSEADFAVDAFLRDALISARPEYGWVSEETEERSHRADGRTFVVDPIDGTRGFIDKSPQWCVSLAVVERGRPVAAVLEAPAKAQSFWAGPGRGAFRNGQRLAVAEPGEKIRIGGPQALIQALAEPLRSRIMRMPYVPSLAYRIAMVADCTLDGTLVKPNAYDWDIAAADLILAEAGGALIDAAGAAPVYGAPGLRHGALAAGSGPLLRSIAAAIA
jgi:myo-inositol-1(or 4)-monophosphatase